ncbi:MAG: peptidase S41, partial [Chloroflexia bacterium]|nr:peptidase S41 [Chloroflexia bacterium]
YGCVIRQFHLMVKPLFLFSGKYLQSEFKWGKAIPLTLNDAYDFMPVWSPDGKSIAFASNRYGNFDVFVMPSEGGKEHRLTYYSGNEFPTSITPDNQYVLFTSLIMDDSKSVQFPDNRFTELYKVPVTAGRVEQVLTTPAEYAKYNKSKNTLLYQDYKGYEDYWRKHHTSGVTRDIWMLKDGKTFQKLSTV